MKHYKNLLFKKIYKFLFLYVGMYLGFNFPLRKATNAKYIIPLIPKTYSLSKLLLWKIQVKLPQY